MAFLLKVVKQMQTTTIYSKMSTIMKIYAIRHGLSECNKRGVINGQKINDSLTEDAYKTVMNTIPALPKKISAIYSSDLLRATQTADIINKNFNLQISLRPELREVDFGSLTGRSWTDIENNELRGLREKYKQSQYDFHEFSGESVEDVEKRVVNFVEELKNKHNNDEVVIITHGGILRLMNHIYKKKDLDLINNGSVNIFNFN